MLAPKQPRRVPSKRRTPNHHETPFRKWVPGFPFTPQTRRLCKRHPCPLVSVSRARPATTSGFWVCLQGRRPLRVDQLWVICLVRLSWLIHLTGPFFKPRQRNTDNDIVFCCGFLAVGKTTVVFEFAFSPWSGRTPSFTDELRERNATGELPNGGHESDTSTSSSSSGSTASQEADE